MKTFFKNYKTTIPALLGALANLLPVLGVPVPPELLNGINVIVLTVIGFFAKDADITGVK